MSTAPTAPSPEIEAPPESAGSVASSSETPRAVGCAIVVGASSGMGAALVRRLAREGWRVAALARRAEPLEALAAECRADAEASGAVIARAHDVHATDEVAGEFEALVRELGGLDLLVYAAGVMPTVGAKEYPTAQDLDMLAVNVGGCIAWCNQAALYLQSQRSGTIVGVSSVAGDRGRKGNPVYCTSKAAMNTYLEALRNRLSESNVHVTTVKPGFVDTAMTQGLDGLFWLISADEAARQILAAARSHANERYVPRRWWFVMRIIRSIPSFVFKRLNV